MVSNFAHIVVALALLYPGVLYARTHHYSLYSDQPAVFLKAIEGYKNSRHEMCKKNSGLVRAGIVTHHFLANRMMVDFFECMASQAKPERVILIGPDHFAKGLNSISVSSLPWKTPFGELSADVNTVNKIKKLLHIGEDVEAFSGEHSIGIIVPFIRYYFPQSVIVPIIVKKRVSSDALRQLKHQLDEFLDDPKTLIILSMDFVHNQTPDEADRRDQLAKKALETLDYERTDSLDIDCHPGFFLLTAALRDRNNIRVDFLNHLNSSRITGIKNLKNVTSYFTILFSQQEATDIH